MIEWAQSTTASKDTDREGDEDEEHRDSNKDILKIRSTFTELQMKRK